MNREGLKQLIRESFKKVNFDEMKNKYDVELEEDSDPTSKWRELTELSADPGNKDFRQRVANIMTENPEIFISVLEALDAEENLELHDEIYRKISKMK